MDFPIATFVSVGAYDILFLVGWCEKKGPKNQPLHQHGDLTNKKNKLRNELLYQQNLELKHPNLSVWTWLNYPKIGLETTSTCLDHPIDLPRRNFRRGAASKATAETAPSTFQCKLRVVGFGCWRAAGWWKLGNQSRGGAQHEFRAQQSMGRYGKLGLKSAEKTMFNPLPKETLAVETRIFSWYILGCNASWNFVKPPRIFTRSSIDLLIWTLGKPLSLGNGLTDFTDHANSGAQNRSI